MSSTAARLAVAQWNTHMNYPNDNPRNLKWLQAVVLGALPTGTAALSPYQNACNLRGWKRVGSTKQRCQCPFPQRHNNKDRTPSFTVDEQTGKFKCECGCRGCFVDVLKEQRGLTEVDAWKAGAAHLGIDLHAAAQARTRLPRPKADKWEAAQVETLLSEASIRLAKHLPETLASFSPPRNFTQAAADYLAVSPDLLFAYFALRDESGISSVFARALRKPYPKAKRQQYSPFSARSTGYFPSMPQPGELSQVFLCEGFEDCIQLLQRGAHAYTRGPAAARLYKPELFRARPVRIAFDNDRAGIAAAIARKGELLEAGVTDIRVVAWPEGTPRGFDLTDWFLAGHTVAALEGLCITDPENVYPAALRRAFLHSPATVVSADSRFLYLVLEEFKGASDFSKVNLPTLRAITGWQNEKLYKVLKQLEALYGGALLPVRESGPRKRNKYHTVSLSELPAKLRNSVLGNRIDFVPDLRRNPGKGSDVPKIEAQNNSQGLTDLPAVERPKCSGNRSPLSVATRKKKCSEEQQAYESQSAPLALFEIPEGYRSDFGQWSLSAKSEYEKRVLALINAGMEFRSAEYQAYQELQPLLAAGEYQ